MKALLAPALALGLLGAATSAAPAEAASIGITIGSPGYHHGGYYHDRNYQPARWHHGRHHVRYCSRWGWRHHARYCRGWGWRRW